MFLVVPLTVVTVSLRLVVARAVKLTVVAVPALSREGTATVLPSEKVRVAGRDLVGGIGPVEEYDAVQVDGGGEGELEVTSRFATGGGPSRLESVG